MRASDGGDKTSLEGFLQQAFACAPEVAASIGQRAAERRFPAESVVIRQGDPVGEAFLVRLGRARARSYGRDGQMVLLQEFLPGDLLGALADTRRQASGE